MVVTQVPQQRRAVARVVSHTLAIGLMLVLAACSSLTPKVVSATLDPAAVQKSADARARLMDALQADAAVSGFKAGDWYEVTRAGFNYVDDQCSVYFSSLFQFRRQTTAAKATLTNFNNTSAAIMQMTGVADITMAVVAQVFGLAGNMTDVVAGTFIYELPPANTQRFVRKAMDAYRDKAAAKRAEIETRTSAYATIRGYLDLCLPVTIEGLLINRVDDTKATATAERSGESIQVDVSGSTGLLDNSGSTLPAVRDVVASPAGIGRVEQSVYPEEWKFIQATICAPVDGVPGPATRVALLAFFDGRGEADPAIATRGINDRELAILRRTMVFAKGRTCAERGIKGGAAEAGNASPV